MILWIIATLASLSAYPVIFPLSGIVENLGSGLTGTANMVGNSVIMVEHRVADTVGLVGNGAIAVGNEAMLVGRRVQDSLNSTLIAAQLLPIRITTYFDTLPTFIQRTIFGLAVGAGLSVAGRKVIQMADDANPSLVRGPRVILKDLSTWTRPFPADCFNAVVAVGALCLAKARSKPAAIDLPLPRPPAGLKLPPHLAQHFPDIPHTILPIARPPIVL